MADREYKRLTRARRRPGFAAIFSSHSSLWLGKDHLLCIDTNGYSENYKRFYFRDIQALIIRKTKRGLIWNTVLGVLTAIYILITAVSTAPELRIIFGILAGCFGLLLLLNLAFGPTCACHLQTAVQTEYLPSLSRINRVRKLLNRIRPLIEEAQGSVATEEIPARMREMLTEEKPPEQPIS